jgi:CBS domain-containing protein
MSPRAAWRLESLGFGEVYEYKVGKLDWLAAGLPTEGTNANKPRAGAIARRDVPTCRLDERLSEVRERANRAGWDVSVAVNEELVVFGLLRAKELAGDGEHLVSDAMRPGPSTFRPYVLAEEMAKIMVDHRRESAPITTSDGRLVGLLLQRDAVEAAGMISG